MAEGLITLEGDDDGWQAMGFYKNEPVKIGEAAPILVADQAVKIPGQPDIPEMEV